MKQTHKYETSSHSCFLLSYHLVVVTKFRHPVITDDLKNRLIEVSRSVLEGDWGCRISEINTDVDHIHILFHASPSIKLCDLVNNYKTVTSRYIRKEFKDELSKYYWKSYFWSDAYFVGTVGDTTEDVIKDYIAEQGRKKRVYHHKAKSTNT